MSGLESSKATIRCLEYKLKKAEVTASSSKMIFFIVLLTIIFLRRGRSQEWSPLR